MTTKNKTPNIVALGAIAAIVILECVALAKGINGTIFTMVVAVIAGLGGYMVKSPIQ